MTNKLNREQWLTSAATLICAEIISPTTEIPAPPIRISIGWPHGTKQNHSKIKGQCFPRSYSQDKHNEIFITPTTNDSNNILATLTHELIHAYDDCQNGHNHIFKRLATKAGLTGPMRQTTPTTELATRLDDITTNVLGPIPHAPLDTSKKKRQQSRQLKMRCQQCPFLFRASQKAINLITNHNCPACQATNSLIQEQT